MAHHLLTALLVLAAVCVQTRTVTISNVSPRFNVTGQIMDAHDGSYSQWSPGGAWYYYAMGYGLCKQGGDMCHGCGYGVPASNRLNALALSCYPLPIPTRWLLVDRRLEVGRHEQRQLDPSA